MGTNSATKTRRTKHPSAGLQLSDRSSTTQTCTSSTSLSIGMLKRSMFYLVVVVLAVALWGCRLPERRADIPYYYIDKSGKKVLNGQGYFGDSFKDGLALVCDEYDPTSSYEHIRYIDHSGKTIFCLNALAASPFSEGLAAVTIRPIGSSTLQTGFVDKRGRWVIQPCFLQARPFSNGLAWVVSKEQIEQFINPQGKIVLTAPEILGRHTVWYGGGKTILNSFVNKMAFVKSDEKCGFIDVTGKWVVHLPNTVKYACFSTDGVISANTSTGPLLFDKEGNLIARLCADAAIGADSSMGGFSEGYAGVHISQRFGYVDRCGALLHLGKFSFPTLFSEGLAAVTVDGKVGYIDRSGKFVIPPQFALGGGFSEGLALVTPFQVVAGEQQRPHPYLWQEPSGASYTNVPLLWEHEQLPDD